MGKVEDQQAIVLHLPKKKNLWPFSRVRFQEKLIPK
jgi:hypothetical protein